MDRRRMDAEDGRVVHRDRRTGKLAVVVAVQNVLVAACLLVTFCVYRDVQTPYSDDIHIQFEAIPDIVGNVTLEFNSISSSNMMGLVNEKNNTIYVNCTGPYILYMDVCYMSLGGMEASGILELQVVGRKTPLINFTLQGSHEVCRGLHSIVYLRVKEMATLHLLSFGQFKIKNVTVGLNYMLGRQCDY